jgi:hypothetical protein
MVGYHECQTERYANEQILRNAKQWVVACDAAQNH